MINEFENNNELNKLKKKFKIDTNCSILEVCIARIYIAYEDSENFEFTNLEGYLCLVINRQYSCFFLNLYGFANYKKEFEIELYTNIDKGYSILNDNFHCIEYPSFFLGINYSSKINAEKMRNSVFYNSILPNAQVSLFSLRNSKKIESDAIRNSKLLNELNNFSSILESQKPQRIAEIFVNNEDSRPFMDANKEEFVKSLDTLGLSVVTLENYFKRQLKGVAKQKSEENLGTGLYKNDKKFVDYNSSKRLTVLNDQKDHIIRSTGRKTTVKQSTSIIYNNQLESQQSSLKHMIHLQVLYN
jgi:hypothetical protein